MLTPEINRPRAELVLSKIDEILRWEKGKEQEKDVRFVELGEHLCEVRARQYWRVESLKSFDDFLERRFPESRRARLAAEFRATPADRQCHWFYL